MSTVLVFTGSLLPASETFIAHHAASLRRHRALLVGQHKVDGIRLDPATSHLLDLNPLEKIALYFLGRCTKLDRLVAAQGVTILHAHFVDNGMLLARYAARRGIPLLVTLHGADVLRRNLPLKRRLLRALLLRSLFATAARLLPVSDYLRDQAASRGYPANRLMRHYLGVPLATAPAAATLPPIPTILFVGRLVEKKGVALLVEAVARIVKSGRQVRLRLIGAGPLGDSLKSHVTARGLPVDFLGARSHDTVLQEMRAASLFCMPSTAAPDGDNEGLGLVYLEAQMLGLPVIAFRQGPVPEAVADGETGLLARDGDVDDLARALIDLIDDPARRAAMAARGPAFVAQKFDIVRQAAQLEDIYDAVLREQTGPSHSESPSGFTLHADTAGRRPS